MAKTEYGIQMYSIRDITKDSMRKALEELAKMGYKYIEFAGFFDYTAEQIKIWLDNFDLVASGTHTGLDALTPERIDETIKYHKAIGCDTVIVPGCNWSTKEKSDSVIDALNFASKKLKENGMKLGYHNHSKEFFATDDGIIFEDEVINKTDCELQIDTFWLYNAGIDVVKYLNEHKDRISVIHLKDGVPTDSSNHNYENAHNDVQGFSVGLGEVPVKEIREWCIKNNVIMVVESEDLNPTGLEEVGRCIEYLRTLD